MLASPLDRSVRIKDVTHYAALFAQEGDLLMDFGNIVDESLYVTCLSVEARSSYFP